MSLPAVLPILVSLTLASDTTTVQMADLRGEWSLVSTQDANHTDPGSEQVKMIVRADGRAVFRTGDVDTNDGAFSVSLCGKTCCADLKLADGKMVRALYERRGDVLIFCFDEAGKPRPMGMSPRGTQWLERW